MPKRTFVHKLSRFMQRFPWLLVVGNTVWRIFQPKYSIGAVGVVFDNAGRVLLVEHAFHARHTWGLPGGWTGSRENPAETVRREISEELSLEVEVGPVLLVEVPYKNHLDLAYLCHTHDKIGEISCELTGYGWFALHNLPPMIDVHHRAIHYAVEIMKTQEARYESGQ